jgi:hypothetical protein
LLFKQHVVISVHSPKTSLKLDKASGRISLYKREP